MNPRSKSQNVLKNRFYTTFCYFTLMQKKLGINI